MRNRRSIKCFDALHKFTPLIKKHFNGRQVFQKNKHAENVGVEVNSLRQDPRVIDCRLGTYMYKAILGN